MVWTDKMATVSDHTTLDCPLCFKTFTTPRSLPCFHTFCEKCLISNFESQRHSGSNFTCPFCTTPIILKQSHLAINKWVSDFPLNSLICSILKSRDFFGNRDVDYHCGPCKTDGENNKAEFWCKDCQEKICSLCRKLHNRNKLLKHHTTVPVEEMDQHLQGVIDFDQECGRHRERVKLFCVDHRELCCAVCVATDHRQCNDVRCIEDIVREQSQRPTFDYSSIIRDIGKLKIEMEKIISEKRNNANQILQEKDKIIHDMDDRIDRIIECLSTLRIAFKRETDQLYKDTERSMHANKRIVENFIKHIENCSEILIIAKRNGTQQQKFITFENIRRQISSHYHQLKSRLSEHVVMHFNMTVNKVLNELEKNLNSIGTVKISTNSSTVTRDVFLDTDRILKSLDSCTKVSTEMCAAQVEKQNVMTSPMIVAKVVTKDELGCGTFFTGGTYIVNGRLVMADYGAHNNRLVELDDEYNIVMEYKVGSKPTDVAAGNKDNEIYVAVVNITGRYIYKCSLHNDLTIVSRIKAPSDTWGIAVSGENIIVGTTGAVVILTQDGSTVRSIRKSGGNSYVTVSQKQRTIYHTDTNDIVCRTYEGQEVFRYQHQQMKTPCGIDIDVNKNVYTCGYRSHNVLQISSDAQRINIMQLQNIFRPYCVVVHPQKKELIVTSLDEDTVFEVYRIG